MKVLEVFVKIIVCCVLVIMTLSIMIPCSIFDIAIGIIVKIFGGSWDFSSFAAWNSVFDHWSKGEFLF